jgi:peptidoglycan/LPS O-acetylase OafA/YrhL
METAGHGEEPESNGMRPPRGSSSVHLDALRGLAAFAVMVSHWRGTYLVGFTQVRGPNPLASTVGRLMDLGPEWVIVFFVLSGYLVGGSVLRARREGRWSWTSYLIARLTRLYAVLIPALILGGTLDWIGMHLAPTEGVYSILAGPNSLHHTLTVPVFLGNLLFLQKIALPGMYGDRLPCFGSNGALWSLTNEFWYYLAFPVMLIAISKEVSLRIRLGSALLLILWAWFVGFFVVFLSIPWLMGVMIPYLPSFPSSGPMKRRTVTIGALALFVVAMMLGSVYSNAYLLVGVVLGVPVSLLIWVTVHWASGPLPSWYTKLSRRAARSSYTLYLIHVPFLVFLTSVFKLPQSISSTSPLIVSIGELIATLLFAQLIYELFEKHTDQIRAWLKSRLLGFTTRSSEFV